MSVTITGPVVGGNKIGRRLGFPTANILIDQNLDIENGVYAAHVRVDELTYNAVANLGYKPSVGSDGKRVLEVNIFDFERSIYGQTIVVTLLDYIREERTFNSLESLKQQIDADKKLVKTKFKNL